MKLYQVTVTRVVREVVSFEVPATDPVHAVERLRKAEGDFNDESVDIVESTIDWTLEPHVEDLGDLI